VAAAHMLHHHPQHHPHDHRYQTATARNSGLPSKRSAGGVAAGAAKLHFDAARLDKIGPMTAHFTWAPLFFCARRQILS